VRSKANTTCSLFGNLGTTARIWRNAGERIRFPAEKWVLPELLTSLSGIVLNIAHRGGTSTYGPNVVQAVRRSTVDGANGVELDVQATRDGALVVFHDWTVRTPAGRRRAASLSVSELRMAVGDTSGERVPLLADVLGAIGHQTAVLVLDIKATGIIDRVAAQVAAAGVTDRTVVASFNREPLARLHAAGSSLPTIVTIGWSRAATNPLGLAWAMRVSFSPVAAAKSVGARGVLCRVTGVRARLVEQAHREGIAVLGWNVAPSTDVQGLVELGIDGLLGDDPQYLRDTLARSTHHQRGRS
jgi:glycerophosphoryl diester phosphodiesterase